MANIDVCDQCGSKLDAKSIQKVTIGRVDHRIYESKRVIHDFCGDDCAGMYALHKFLGYKSTDLALQFAMSPAGVKAAANKKQEEVWHEADAR